MIDVPPLEIRNLRFATEGDPPKVPRHWHGGRKSVTTFFDNLSIFFPAGERFFVASVRAFEHRVSGERELCDVRAFYGQEGVHGREHVRYNKMLLAHGLPVDAMERRVERLIARVTRRLPRRMHLAVTAALEHFTALLAHLILSEPRLLAGAHPEMAALWRWHAAEENEHKAVAFDVHVAAGGTHGERVVAMLGATVIFWAKVLEHQIRLMHHDGTALSPSEWWALVRFLFVEPGGMARLIGPYLAWYRADFHPWDLDSRDVVERWKAGLAGAEA